MDLSNENVVHVKKQGVEYLQFRRLLPYQENLQHAYSLGTSMNFRTARVGGKSLAKEEYEKAMQDYQKLCKEMDGNYIEIVKTNQSHTDEVKVIEKKLKKDEPDINLEEYEATDGLITNKKNLILSTTNADCILLFFFDPVKNVIANVHSGWRGTLQRISVKAVEKMKEKFDCKPKDIICCICPSIRKCHFEVEKDVKDPFENEFSDLGKENLTRIIEEKILGKKWNIDTVLINQIILEKEGLKKENIVDSGICSVCHADKIHSYRVEKQGYGLNAALIKLK